MKEYNNTYHIIKIMIRQNCDTFNLTNTEVVRLEAQRMQSYAQERPKKQSKPHRVAKGVALTFLIAVIAGFIAKLPFFKSWGL